MSLRIMRDRLAYFFVFISVMMTITCLFSGTEYFANKLPVALLILFTSIMHVIGKDVLDEHIADEVQREGLVYRAIPMALFFSSAFLWYIWPTDRMIYISIGSMLFFSINSVFTYGGLYKIFRFIVFDCIIESVEYAHDWKLPGYLRNSSIGRVCNRGAIVISAAGPPVVYFLIFG